MKHSIVNLPLLAGALITAPAAAQIEPEAGVCATVKVEIQQELTFERVGFEGRLVISNDEPNVDLENVLVEIDISEANSDEPTTSTFFIQAPQVRGMTGLPDGTGTITSGSTARITWLFVPTADAGGEDPRGKQYLIGARLYAVVNGKLTAFPIFPDDVTVLPQPKLDIDYFIPRDVLADDPFTLETVEEPVPFDLGVRINNIGYGAANRMKLSSGQPKIVENEKNLLIAFRLLNAFTHNLPIPNPSLTMDFGNVPARSARVGRWQMMTTLMGKFTEFTATYSHSSALGGEMTSLITSLDTHFLTHTMRINEPGFDNVYDFLADTTKDDDLLPETIFSSEGQDFPVNVLEGVTEGFPTNAAPTVTLKMNNLTSGWVYTRVPDPSQGLLQLVSVKRSDGKNILVPENAWISKRIVRLVGQSARTEYTFHVVDLNSTGEYTLTFTPPPADELAPETRPIVQEPNFGTDPDYYGTNETQVYLFAQDDVSGVANTVWSINGAPYTPAFPITFPTEGKRTFEYYSVDRAGNTEEPKTFSLTVDLTPPAIDQFALPPQFIPQATPNNGDAQLVMIAQATDEHTPFVDLKVEIAPGTVACEQFASNAAIHTTSARVPSGQATPLFWNGRTNGTGWYANPGTYTARLTAADPLGHSVTSCAMFVLHEPRESVVADATSADQMYPDVDGNTVVWQDMRNGNTNADIAIHRIGATPATTILELSGSQERPRVSGDHVVFQDNRSGNYDIYLHTISSGATEALFTGTGNQTKPDISGDFVVWQSDQNGNVDLYLHQISTGETKAIEANPSVQSNPRIDGDIVVWEDFRHGLGEIYQYVISAGLTTRLTDNLFQQEDPTVHNGRVVWTDKINTFRDIYSLDGGVLTNLTPGDTEQAEPAASSAATAFADYTVNAIDANLAVVLQGQPGFYPITSQTSPQRYPALSGSRLAWQDQRSGRWQVRLTDLNIPVADAGADLFSSTSTQVILNGSASINPIEGELEFAWTQLAGPAVTITGGNTAQPTFIAPSVSREEVLVFQLVVSNSEYTSAPDVVVVRVRPINLPPIAVAGNTQTVHGLQLVTLDGTASSDPDGNPLTPTWSFLSDTTATLNLANPMKPTFIAPDVKEPHQAVIQLTVSDGQFISDTDTVTINILPRVNQKPKAFVASDIIVDEGQLVTLDGTPSFDPENLPISYHWLQVEGPAVTFDATSAQPTFTAPQVTQLTPMRFRLVVRDEAEDSDPAEAFVTVRDLRNLPVARVVANVVAQPGDIVTLDGTESYHPENLPFTYSWSQVSGPEVALLNANTATPSFTAPAGNQDQTLVFTLILADGNDTSFPAEVTVLVDAPNNAPVANAGDDFSATRNTVVTLNGTGSSDPDGDTLSYTWTQLGGPAVVLQDANTATPKFNTPDVAQTETIVFQLVVNDGAENSAPDTVTITVLPFDPYEAFLLY